MMVFIEHTATIQAIGFDTRITWEIREYTTFESGGPPLARYNRIATGKEYRTYPDEYGVNSLCDGRFEIVTPNGSVIAFQRQEP